MSERRKLSYDNWDEVLDDIQQLSSGNTQHGKWNLEQAAKHLNDWLSFPMDGFPQSPLLVRLILGSLRLTIGPSLLKKMIATHKMQDGGQTIPTTVYASSENEAATQAAVNKLVESIARFRAHNGPIIPSPLFGKMDKATAQQLQLLHFAHHLSWLSPKPT